MVGRWGLERFSTFYRDITSAPSGSHAQAIDTSLIVHFGLTFSELEQEFIKRLRQEHVEKNNYDDIRLTVMFYDTVRRYQQLLDPSAYFLTAWLPDSKEMRDRGIVADFLRHPIAQQNVALEAMLVEADARLRDGDFIQTENLLSAINAVLSGLQNGDEQAFEIHPLANDFYEITIVLQEKGYQVQRIRLREDIAIVSLYIRGVMLEEIEMQKEGEEWQAPITNQ
jgi:hypothetical protein